MPLDQTKELPIYLKAMQIVHLTQGLSQIIPDENEYLQHIKEFMIADSFIIPAKIAGAEGGDLYDLRMENAAIIRKAARDLYVSAGSLRFHGIKNLEYINLLRKEIDEFKLLFVDWVASFDVWNYIVDDWGLFNPPGIVPGNNDDNEPFSIDDIDFESFEDDLDEDDLE